MNRETARWYLEAWAKGAHISSGIVESAIDALVHGKPVPFVEGCIGRREALEGRKI